MTQFTAARTELPARVFVTAGGLETIEETKRLLQDLSTQGGPSKVLADRLVSFYEHQGWPRMAEITAEFAARLQTCSLSGVDVLCHNLPDETHMSVWPAGISRGLRHVFGAWKLVTAAGRPRRGRCPKNIFAAGSTFYSSRGQSGNRASLFSPQACPQDPRATLDRARGLMKRVLRREPPGGENAGLLRRLSGNPALATYIRQLPAATVVRLIEEVGLEDSQEILAAMDARQLRETMSIALGSSDTIGHDETLDIDQFVRWMRCGLAKAIRHWPDAQ
jgi:hypothetical protein